MSATLANDLEGVLNNLYKVSQQDYDRKDHRYGKFYLQNKLRKKLVQKKIKHLKIHESPPT